MHRAHSNTGKPTNPAKNNNISQAKRPETTEKAKSRLQAGPHNAKFTSDQEEGRSHNKTTTPLGDMRVKKEHPTRPEVREASYQASREGSWKPVEHGDKAMSDTEQEWALHIK